MPRTFGPGLWGRQNKPVTALLPNSPTPDSFRTCDSQLVLLLLPSWRVGKGNGTSQAAGQTEPEREKCSAGTKQGNGIPSLSPACEVGLKSLMFLSIPAGNTGEREMAWRQGGDSDCGLAPPH